MRRTCAFLILVLIAFTFAFPQGHRGKGRVKGYVYDEEGNPLGLAHLTLGQQKEAVEVFENYLEHDPDSERASQVKGFLEYLKK